MLLTTRLTDRLAGRHGAEVAKGATKAREAVRGLLPAKTGALTSSCGTAGYFLSLRLLWARKTGTVME
jgi:hypothetical protein